MKSILYSLSLMILLGLGSKAWSLESGNKPLNNSSAEEELWPDWGQADESAPTDDPSLAGEGEALDNTNAGWGSKGLADATAGSGFSNPPKIRFHLVKEGEERPKGSRRPPKVVR